MRARELSRIVAIQQQQKARRKKLEENTTNDTKGSALSYFRMMEFNCETRPY